MAPEKPSSDPWGLGQKVWYNRSHGIILAHFHNRNGHGLTVHGEDGRLSYVFPFALNR